MSWGKSGCFEQRCPECRSEWWGSYVSWYYDPHQERVTTERKERGREEWHDPSCRHYKGKTLEDRIREETSS